MSCESKEIWKHKENNSKNTDSRVMGKTPLKLEARLFSSMFISLDNFCSVIA